jgi:SAM-dependent methyltransferase
VAINRSLVNKPDAPHSIRGVSQDYDATLAAPDRKRTGTWYTPHALVAHVVAQSMPTLRRGEVVRVLDPACGDGRFLYEAERVIRAAGAVPELTGVDIDLGGLAPTRTDAVEVIHADALAYAWGDRHFDVVLGNPPFLSQMASATARSAPSAFGGGPYADAAADFLALALRLARPDGGRVGLVLPLSLLTARDAGPIRAAALQSAALDWFWASRELVFEAMVRTCAVGLQRGAVAGPSTRIRRSAGIAFDSLAPVAHDSFATANDHWGSLIADSFGVPSVPPLRTVGTLSEHALATANFRDQYYGLVGAVSDSGDGPPLITTGLIDVAECQWGKRQTRFAKQRFDAPRVDREQLAPFMQRWADRCLVPKVLVATQTHVLEAVADERGEWLPAVPVIRVVPDDPRDVWAMAALLTSPVASALIAEQSVGSGLSATTVRVSQRTLGALPWPEGSLRDAVHALHNGDIEGCGRAVDAAFGIAATDDDELFSWWHNAVKHQSGRH